MYGLLLPLHVAAGGLALVLGAVALVVQKGGTTHRRSGLLFVVAMLVMALTAALLGNWGGGAMTAYFVVTALAAVRSASPWTRPLVAAALTFAAGLALRFFLGGLAALGQPRGVLDGVPFAMFFLLAAVLILATIGDVRVLRSGMPRGRPRLARHLWRMCFALFIAAGSFFSIRERVAKILPEPLTTAPLRALPVLLVFGAMFYWLWRLRARRTLPVVVGSDAVGSPQP